MSTITLPNIRVGSDLQVRVRLKDGGVAIDWSTLSNIKACIYSDAQRALAGRCAFSIDEEDNTLLVCTYAANKPQYLGVNRIVISAKYMGETKTYDKPAFSFVRWTADQEGEEITIDDPDVDVEIDVEDVSSSILQEAVDAAFSAADRANEAAAAAEHMVDIHTGPEGKSAYEVAVEEGYTGTEEEWLASLVGPQGAQGIQGETGEAAGFGSVSAALQEDGGDPSVVVAASGEDTSKNFAFTFKNLKGDKGDKGDQGNTGSSVDYPYELVNNCTTDDATKGLAASQGVALKAEVSQLEAEVDDKFSDITPNLVRDSDGDGFQITDSDGYVGLSFKDGELDVKGVGENLEGIIKNIADEAIEETEVIEERAEQVVKTSDLTMRLVEEDGLFVVDADGYIGGVLFGDYGKVFDLSVNVDIEQKTASFVSVLSSKYLIKNTVRWEEDETMTGNPVMNFNGTSIIEIETGTEKVINQESDNICPISFSKYENLGGNHGLSTKKVVCDTTGIGYSAIGKQLSCNGNECYIVRILADGVLVFPGHNGDTFKTLPISIGDTITGDGISISVTSVSTIQMYPACVNREKKLTLGGNTITESGDYVGNDVRFFDTYDIFDPISFLDNIIANSGSWTANPTLETADPDFLVRRSIMYQFVKGGLCLIYDNFSILKDTYIASEYGLNIKPMYTASVTNGVKKYYLPKSLPLVYDKTTGQRATESTAEANKVTFDFRLPTTQDTSLIPGFDGLGDRGLNYKAEDCENGNPIERGVSMLDFDGGRIVLQHGYAPGFQVFGENRPKYTSILWRMRANGDYWTIYPQAYNSGAELFSGLVAKGQAYGYVCFRKYADGYNDIPTGILSVFDFRLNNAHYVYADILSPGIYDIPLPKELYGKKVEVLYHRDNTSVLNVVATDKIQISVSESASGVNYGYCLIKL